MTDCYTWEWLGDVALLTLQRRMTLADAEELEAAMPTLSTRPQHVGRAWGLVVDLTQSGVLDVPAQAVVKRLMIANVRAGCSAKAMVVGTMIGKMQSQRLGQEAQQASDNFNSVPEALASVHSKLAVVLQ